MVKWSGPAKRDLRQIHNYIAKDSKYYARNVTENIVAKTERLKDFPEIGRVVPEIGDPNVRELFLYSYRLVYEIKSDRVEILAIIHAKRDFLSVGRTELDR
jgi:toxin ParE1/3/4